MASGLIFVGMIFAVVSLKQGIADFFNDYGSKFVILCFIF